MSCQSIAKQSTLPAHDTSGQTRESGQAVLSERAVQLKAYMFRQGLTVTSLAKQVGVEVSYLSRILRGDRRPAHHIAALIDLGIPAELLPEPSVDSSRNRSTSMNGQSDSLDG